MCVSDSLFYYVCHFQEDYVKWKDSLFFRFLSMLVDDELRRYGMYVYTYVLCMYALKFCVCMYVCIYVCTYMYACIRMYIHAYIHIYGIPVAT